MRPNRIATAWLRFVAIAQPYFFPRIPHGGKLTLLLMTLLLLGLFSVLALLVGTLVLAANAWAPEMTGRVAGGLLHFVQKTVTTNGWLLVAAGLGLPAAVFYWQRSGLCKRGGAWALLAVVLLLSLMVTGINVAFSYIGNYFTNAMVAKDQALSYFYVWLYLGGFIVGIPVVAFYGYVQDFLGMRWRQWMTNDLLGKYFGRRNYYTLESEGAIDNPDQRIMEDVRTFTRTSLSFLLILLGALMNLIGFVGILWSTSTLLVAVVLGYSLVGTLITALIGRRLVGLNFNQLRYEADFRYGLVHVRDNVESIAFYRGEEPERLQIGRRFARAIGNFSLLIGWQRNLSFFTTAYSYLPLVLPFVILFPLYFGGQIQYGDMVQANIAFMQIYTSMSLIVSQIEQITGFAAGVQRLAGFTEALEAPRQSGGIASRETDGFGLVSLTLQPPKGKRTLLADLDLTLSPDENLVIVGPSGIGKSSLLRAVAGLWSRGSGQVSRPARKEIFFLPQKPYMLLGSLRQQLCYPRWDQNTSDRELKVALKAVNLNGLDERVGGLDAIRDWADLLSMGEQQRLAFARLLVYQPRFAVLDEATSALDRDNEAHLYRLLSQYGVRYVSVGHRASIVPFHDRVLNLQNRNEWSLTTVEDFLSAQSERE